MNAQGNGGRGERDVLCYHSQLHSGCCEEELLPLLLGGDAARMERVIGMGVFQTGREMGLIYARTTGLV